MNRAGGQAGSQAGSQASGRVGKPRSGILRALLSLLCVLSLLSLPLFLSGCARENPWRAAVLEKAGENRRITGDYDETMAVSCKNGVFVGPEEDSVLSFKGIPYAEPPVGALRRKPPVDAAESDGVYEAYYFGTSPIQTE